LFLIKNKKERFKLINKSNFYNFTKKKVNLKNIEKVNREKYVLAGITGSDLLNVSIDNIGDSDVRTADGMERKSKIIYYHFLNNMQDIIANGKGYILHGKKGTGKTSLAVLMAKSAINFYNRNLDVKFIDWKKYQEDYFFKTWSKNEKIKEDAKVWIDDNIYNSDLLIIDDLAKGEKDHRKVVEHFLMIIRYRDQHDLSTIITMNIDFQKLDEVYNDEHDALSDVLKYNNTPINFFGKSYRNKKYKEKVQKTKEEFEEIERRLSNEN
jgi:DNA replication protein DnaC